ncbi:MAG: phosphatidate cytidylyltransferase [Desulfosudaceae bacterium]
MHLQRWLTAIILIPFVVTIIYFSPSWFFTIFIWLASLIALYEYYGIVLAGSDQAGLSVTTVSGFLAATVIIFAAPAGRFDVICLLLCGLLVFSGMRSLRRYGHHPEAPATVLKQITGQVYLPLILSLAVVIHQGSHGVTWLFLLLVIVFLGDTGAYYAGTYLGRHKLLPEVSPKKTIQGALGGLLATVLAGCLANGFFPVLPGQLDMPRLPWVGAVIMFVAISICGQAGDLFESVLKRESGVKDSGVIFPGHGGLLDRIDAVLFAVPVAYLFKIYVFTS